MFTHDTQDESDECDPDDQIEEMMAPNESEGNNADGDMGSENEHTLDATEQEYELESEVGPPIHEQLAKVLTTMAKGKMDTEKFKSKLEKHKIPQNCETLVVPRVNPEIWNILDNSTRSNDFKLQRTQKSLLKATFALAKTGDTCVKSTSAEMKALLRDVTDAIGLNLKTIHELSMERRAKILSAQNVKQKYRKLAHQKRSQSPNFHSEMT